MADENRGNRRTFETRKAFAEAIVRNDPEAIERFVSDDWIVIDPDGGIVERTRFLAVIKSGALTHKMMESGDLRVRVYGDSAVVTAITARRANSWDRSSARRNGPQMFL